MVSVKFSNMYVYLTFDISVDLHALWGSVTFSNMSGYLTFDLSVDYMHSVGVGDILIRVSNL